jgi:serine/threonine protein kinase
LGGPRALHADIFIAAVVACTVGSPSRCSKQAAHSAQDSFKLNQPFSSSASFDSDLMASSSSNVVGVHYRVGKKIGEGSFGVIFEGTNLLNNQQVAIKFVR